MAFLLVFNCFLFCFVLFCFDFRIFSFALLFALFVYLFVCLFVCFWCWWWCWCCLGLLMGRQTCRRCLGIRKRDMGDSGVRDWSRQGQARSGKVRTGQATGLSKSLFHRFQSMANPEYAWCTGCMDIHIIYATHLLYYCINYYH